MESHRRASAKVHRVCWHRAWQSFAKFSRTLGQGNGRDLQYCWPFAWYVRDYTNVCFNYPDGCPATAKTYPVIISGGDNLYTAESQYAGNKGSYVFHQYHMRTWWDEGYKPPPCVPSRTNNCADQPTYGGVGVGLWLSYGDTPPPNAKFNPGLAAQHIWQWWWERRAIGSTDGTYDMGLSSKKVWL